jgi:hypothetical protein
MYPFRFCTESGGLMAGAGEKSSPTAKIDHNKHRNRAERHSRAPAIAHTGSPVMSFQVGCSSPATSKSGRQEAETRPGYSRRVSVISLRRTFRAPVLRLAQIILRPRPTEHGQPGRGLGSAAAAGFSPATLPSSCAMRRSRSSGLSRGFSSSILINQSFRAIRTTSALFGLGLG